MKPVREQLEAPPQSSFRCSRRRSRGGFPFAWHHHRDYELTLISRGAGRRWVGDRVEDFRAPDLVLVGPDVPHTWEVPAARRDAEAVVVQFAPDWAARFAPLPEWRAIGALLTRARRGLAFRGRGAAVVTRALLALPARQGADRLAALIAILAQLAAAEARILGGPDAAEAPEPVRAGRFESVRRWLAEHLADDVTQAAAARHVGMTPAAFSRWFRRATGQTFTAYVQQLRVADATRALLASDHPITGIAFAAGFANLSHFNRCFRRVHGMTPRELRAAHDGGGAAAGMAARRSGASRAPRRAER